MTSPISVCLALTGAISRTRTVDEIFAIVLDALTGDLGVSCGSILLFDDDGVMRFKAWRNLSDDYRAAVEGYTPWAPDSVDAAPVVIADAMHDPALLRYRDAIEADKIAAMACIPIVSLGRVIGMLMLCYRTPRTLAVGEFQAARLIASQIAFAVERTRAEAQARRSEERLRFSLDAARTGTWEWDLTRDTVRWSDNLERMHGLPQGSFDGSFASYEAGIHIDDRERVLEAIRRSVASGVPLDVEYRIMTPDGSVRWVEGKGRVEREDGRPVRMTGVCMDVTRRKTAEATRIAAAEEASRLKDEFLATLSHELRTPLNAVLGWVGMLQRDELTAERRIYAIEAIARNVRRQAQLIEDVLDVSRIIAGKLDVDFEPVAIGTLLDTVIADAAPLAERAGLSIVLDRPADLPLVEGDPRRLQQVFGNVLSNAVKFTPEGGRVTIRCHAEGHDVVTEIADTGIGIPPSFLPFVFERFRQADSRATRKHGGLGLGLAIARHLLERHHGEIRAESDGPGLGTRVIIRLPALFPAGRVVRRLPAPVAVTEPSIDGRTVMVVDDHDDSREVLALLLEQRGARVLRCEGARDALELLARGPVDLLVADIAMPEIDGYELIARVRREHAHLPAVALSAFARPEDRARALSAGYDAYCVKPISGPELLTTIGTVLAS